MARKSAAKQVNRVVAGELRGFIERVERLLGDRVEISDQIKAVMAEAKARGYDTKVIRKIIKERALDESDLAAIQEIEAIAQVYREALGMAGTPLGEWARGGDPGWESDPDEGDDPGGLGDLPASSRPKKARKPGAAAAKAQAQEVSALDPVKVRNIAEARRINAERQAARDVFPDGDGPAAA